MIADYDKSLLGAALAFAKAGDVADLLRIMTEAMVPLDRFILAGLGMHDPRRRTVVVYAARHADAKSDPRQGAALSLDGEEFPVSETELAAMSAESPTYVSPDLNSDCPLSIHRRLRDAGVGRYVSMPLRLGDQLLGTLYACFAGGAAPAREILAYLELLALILTPALWSHRTRIRLSKGDRRRAALIDLSHAINTSLKLEPVLRSAGRAITRIEGHCSSIIGLLEEDGETFRAYHHDQLVNSEKTSALEPELLPVGSTALPWILKHQSTYESDDLEKSTRFEVDAEFRKAGARRYVAAPLFVRGKIIGTFFFGTRDLHPALNTDLWLYENIALQLALAIDNARQFEELQHLSEQLRQQNVYLREEIEAEHDVEGMIGRSPGMQRVFEEISRVAKTDASVLITGETGVGKELVARAVHARSGRASHPLVKVNCAAIPEGLVESELFGHERGAFTSASSRRIGRFELAKDGTLFLDEVGELPPAVQAKLLRVLQDGEFERVGGTETIRTGARIVAATNRNLAKAVENKTFRSDLYYRLKVFPIQVPALRDRPDDIPLLVDSFITQLNRRMGTDIQSIEPASLEYLCRRNWHGNVRELHHVIERAMILCDGQRLTVEASDDLGVPPTGAQTQAEPPGDSPPRSAVVAGSVVSLQEAERDHIRLALRETGGVVDGPRGAAALLGLKPSTLRSRMKRLGIQRVS